MQSKKIKWPVLLLAILVSVDLWTAPLLAELSDEATNSSSVEVTDPSESSGLPEVTDAAETGYLLETSDISKVTDPSNIIATSASIEDVPIETFEVPEQTASDVETASSSPDVIESTSPPSETVINSETETSIEDAEVTLEETGTSLGENSQEPFVDESIVAT